MSPVSSSFLGCLDLILQRGVENAPLPVLHREKKAPNSLLFVNVSEASCSINCPEGRMNRKIFPALSGGWWGFSLTVLQACAFLIYVAAWFQTELFISTICLAHMYYIAQYDPTHTPCYAGTPCYDAACCCVA